MCSPIIGAALSVAGGLANASSQQEYVDAVNQANNNAYMISRQARLDEQARQKQFEGQAQNYWQTSMDATTQPKQTQLQDQSVNSFMNTYDTNAGANKLNTDGMYLSGQNTAPEEIKSEIAARASKAAVEARTRAQALAQLSSYGSVGTTTANAIADQSNNLTTLGGIRKGSLAVSNQEQNISPAKVTPASGGLGDILGGIGSIASAF